ncbi:MAG: hypothetical protein ACK4JE_00185 [Endomicrobiia bacterium]
MENNLKLEELIKLGEKSKEQKDYDQAIHYYNMGLRIAPDDIKINTEIAKSYALKAENEKDDSYKFRYYQLAMEHYRKVLKVNPTDEDIHKAIILLSQKTNTLDDLAIEYKDKFKKTTDQSLKNIYEDCLKKIYTISGLDKRFIAQKFKNIYYEPSLAVKIFFDFLFLPLGIFLLCLSIFDNRFRPLLLESIILLVFYLAYRLVIILARR